MKDGMETVHCFNSLLFFPKALKLCFKGRSSGLLRFRRLPVLMNTRTVAKSAGTLKELTAAGTAPDFNRIPF